MRASSHSQNIHRMRGIRRHKYWNTLGHLPDGKSNICVDLVAVRGHHQRSVLNLKPLVCLGIVYTAQRHINSQIIKFQRAMKIVDNDHVILLIACQLFDKTCCHGVIICYDNMSCRIRRQLTGGAALCLCVHPGREKELDENKGKQNQQKNNARCQHNDRKQTADI